MSTYMSRIFIQMGQKKKIYIYSTCKPVIYPCYFLKHFFSYKESAENFNLNFFRPNDIIDLDFYALVRPNMT